MKARTSLQGDTGSDKLFGGAGDDGLDGGLDFDRCFGRSGIDSATGCEVARNIP